MKNKQHTIYMIVGLTLLLSIMIVVITSCQSAVNMSKPITDAHLLYANAVNAVTNASNLSLKISQSKTTKIGGQTFGEQSTQTVSYEAMKTGHMRGLTEESLTVGPHNVTVSEMYADGVGYFTVEGSRFCGELSQDEYLSRYTPAIPICADLYANVVGIKTSNLTEIYFTQPTDIEPWVLHDSAKLICAEGVARIDKNGYLTESVYNISYWVDDAYIRLVTAVEIVYNESPEIQLPADVDSYRKIAYLDGPKMLEKASGYILSSTNITAEYSDSIFCQAFGDQRDQTITIDATTNPQLSVQLDTLITLTNSSKSGIVAAHTQTEMFADDVYTIATDSSEPTVNQEINEETMLKYYRDILVGTIMLPQYITDSTITETDKGLCLSFTANDELAKLFLSDACMTLYQDPNILNDQAQAYATDTMRYYLTVDKHLALPTESGFHYSGTYTIDSLPYQLSFKADQRYNLGN